MKKLFKLSLLSLMALLFFTSCTQLGGLLGKNRIPQALSSLLEPINTKNKAIEKPLINFQSYMNEDLPLIYYKEPDEITDTYYLDDTYTLDEVTEDVIYLFEELKGKYGGYTYFGGDEAFNKAKTNILKELNSLDIITGEAFQDIIIQNLSFIKDHHFMINLSYLNEEYYGYQYSESDFQKQGDSYINASTGKVVYSINGDTNIGSYFKMSLSKAGSLVYYPVLITQGKKAVNIAIEYTDKTEEKAVILSSHYTISAGTSLRLDKVDNIPILRVPAMYFEKGDEKSLARKFLSYGKKLRGEPIVIVDLRGNMGGNGMLPPKWFKNFTKELVPTNYSSLRRDSRELSLNNNNSTSDRDLYNQVKDAVIYGNLQYLSDKYSTLFTLEDRYISNDTLLILLVNKETASAAEMFVDMSRNVENTLVVGTNTSGCLIGDSNYVISLPNTGMVVGFGTLVSFFPDNYFEEFVGFEPDLWIDGNLEEKLIKFLKSFTNNQ